MQPTRLLDREHVLVKICGCNEHSLALEECQKLTTTSATQSGLLSTIWSRARYPTLRLQCLTN